jgi:hypothetical protein
MLLFRSEEHVERWCRQWNRPRGAVISVAQQWRLAQAWYEQDRGDPGWRRKTPEETEAIFRDIGLVGDFWRFQ